VKEKDKPKSPQQVIKDNLHAKLSPMEYEQKLESLRKVEETIAKSSYDRGMKAKLVKPIIELENMYKAEKEAERRERISQEVWV
jgi:hypothetical protein